MTRPYEVIVTGPASRAISDGLPKSVAWAVIELLDGPLSQNPHRIGHRLGNDLAGLWSARRGDFRVIYRSDETLREVTG